MTSKIEKVKAVFGSIFSTVTKLFDFFPQARILNVYGDVLFEFVSTTAELIESIIDDTGYGNEKVVLFDQFLAELVESSEELKKENRDGIYKAAHMLLTIYVKGQNLRGAWKSKNKG